MTRNPNSEEEPDTSWHAASDPQKCLDMERKYGWQLLRIRPISGGIFKVKCIFKGKTQFPDYQEDQDN